MVEISRKLQERKLQWCGHVERFVRKKVSRIEVPGNIMGKGGPKKTWKNRVIKDMREKELTEEAQHQDLWRED